MIVMMVVYISGNQTRNKVGNTQPNVYSSQSILYKVLNKVVEEIKYEYMCM